MVSSECLELVKELLSINLPKLATKFKEAEVIGGKVISPIYLRLDGVRFSKVLKGFKHPRDLRVHEALTEASKEILKWFNGDLAYVSSDEINVLITKPLPYGGRVFKLVSVSASIASSVASLRLNKPLYFDSRVIKLGSAGEGIEYLMFRARVCLNNYLSSLYHTYLSKDKGLTPATTDMLDELLKSGLLNDKDDWELLGTVITWSKVVREGRNLLTNEKVVVTRRTLREVLLHEFLKTL